MTTNQVHFIDEHHPIMLDWYEREEYDQNFEQGYVIRGQLQHEAFEVIGSWRIVNRHDLSRRRNAPARGSLRYEMKAAVGGVEHSYEMQRKPGECPHEMLKRAAALAALLD